MSSSDDDDFDDKFPSAAAKRVERRLRSALESIPRGHSACLVLVPARGGEPRRMRAVAPQAPPKGITSASLWGDPNFSSLWNETIGPYDNPEEAADAGYHELFGDLGDEDSPIYRFLQRRKGVPDDEDNILLGRSRRQSGRRASAPAPAAPAPAPAPAPREEGES